MPHNFVVKYNITPLIKEEKPLPGGGGKMSPGSFDLDELSAGSHADQEPEC